MENLKIFYKSQTINKAHAQLLLQPHMLEFQFENFLQILESNSMDFTKLFPKNYTPDHSITCERPFFKKFTLPLTVDPALEQDLMKLEGVRHVGLTSKNDLLIQCEEKAQKAIMEIIPASTEAAHIKFEFIKNFSSLIVEESS